MIADLYAYNIRELRKILYSTVDVLDAVNIQCVIADKYFECKKYNTAIRYYHNTINKARNLKDSLEREVILRMSNDGLAMSFMMKKKYDKAIKFFKEAIQYKSIENRSRKNAEIFSMIGLAHFQNQDYNKALENFNIALSLKDGLPDKEIEQDIRYYIAEIYNIKKVIY